VKLGFIGLGDMGQAIVPRLLAAGHQVAGWNRTKEKAEPLFKLGMGWADSPKQLAAESEIVFTIVCLLYTSPSPRALSTSRMPSSA